MPENYRKNNVRSSKISDLNSKIREAENDLAFSKGIRSRNLSVEHNFRQISRPPSSTTNYEVEEVSELQILRLKQIETAQRLKETLRRNVDLMTELQKARSVVRTLEKKISILEDGRSEIGNLDFDDKDIRKSMCSHCPKQEQEINQLKLHIIEMNDSFQRRWEETQRELSQARQSLADVSNKLYESMNNKNNNNNNNSVSNIHLNTVNSSNSNNMRILEDTDYSNIHVQNPGLINSGKINSDSIRSGTQSPSTFKFSRPTSSNFTNESNPTIQNIFENVNSNVYDLNKILIKNNSPNIQEFSLANNQNFRIENHNFNQIQESNINNKIRSIRPQSENSSRHLTYDFKPLTGVSSNIRSIQSSQRSNLNNNYHDLSTKIPSFDSLTLRPDAGNYNSFPIKGNNSNFSGVLPGNLTRESYIGTPITPPTIYPNTYSSILPSQQKNLSQMNIPNSNSNNIFSLNSLSKSSSNYMDNANYEQFSDSRPFQNIESTSNHLNYKSNSHLPPNINSNNNHVINNSPSLPSISSNNIQPQVINTSPYNETPNEYPSSPTTKESQVELEVEQNTYGNIRKTLEELKKTQDERVQQLKNDREKLLRAVLNDLQEMRDFQSNLASVKEQQESMIKNAPKKLFSLDQNINSHENS